MPSLQDQPSLYDAILFQARLMPHAVAVVLEGRELTYREFARDIERVTRRLHARGIPPGERVGVNVTNFYLRWLVTIGLMRIGAVSAAVGETSNDVQMVRARYVLADKAMAAADAEIVAVNESWLGADADALPAFVDRRFPRDAGCRIVLSSGTTGVPKKALLSFGDIRDRMAGTARTYDLGTATRLMTTMGYGTIAGFTMNLASWCAGGAAVLTVKSSATLQQMLALKPDVFFASTAQLEGMVRTLPADHWPWRPLRVFAAGSLVPPSLSRTVRSRLAQSFFIIYGSTEAGSVTLAHGLRAEQIPGFTGYVLPSAQIEVVDEAGVPVPAGEAGEVRIRSQGMIARYEDEPEGAEPAFRDGWFYPGDLGSFTPDGGLVILGRTREVMNFNGVKHAPHVLEQAVAGCPGVKDLAAFALEAGGRTSPWLAVVAGDDFSEPVLMERFARAFAGLPRLRIARVSAIPRNAMGKVMRADLRSRVESAIGASAGTQA